MQILEKKEGIRLTPKCDAVKRYETKIKIASTATQNIQTLTQNLSKNVLKRVSELVITSERKL